MSKPARLYKDCGRKSGFSIFDKTLCRVERWVLSHQTLCLAIALIVGMTIFIALAYAVCGVSATGDTIYNGMESVI